MVKYVQLCYLTILRGIQKHTLVIAACTSASACTFRVSFLKDTPSYVLLF
jgi:hypothetical protein